MALGNVRAKEIGRYEIAGVNIAQPVEPMTSLRLADFVALLEPVNALADRSPGFVWRLQTEDGDATAVRVFDDEQLIVNLTVWESLEHLAEFVLGASMPMSCVAVGSGSLACVTPTAPRGGTTPTVSDAEERLAALRRHGPTPFAFTMRRPFPAPGTVGQQPADEGWYCPA